MQDKEYKFRSRWLDFLFLVLVLMAIAVFVYARVKGGRVETRDGIMSRRALPAVMFSDETLNVELRLDGKVLPRCNASVAPADPVYAILILDTSGSMSGKLDGAKTAAIDFIDLLDMDIDRVAVIQFSDTATTLSTFSTSRDSVVDAVERLYLNSSTNMYDGFQKAYDVIQASSIPQNAVRLVILLSDGGWNTGGDPAPVAQQVRAAGFRVTAVALEVSDSSYLTPLVENPTEDIVSASDPTQLVQSFGQIAQRYINLIATDIRLNELYNSAAFRLVPDSARGADASQLGVVRWNWLFLGDRGRNTGYRLEPIRMGMQHVVDSPGDMYLTDCTGQILAQTLPHDPVVLVLFPSWILWLIALLALLWLIYRILEEVRFGRVHIAKPAPPAPDPYVRQQPQRPSNKESATGHWHGRTDD